MQVERSYGLSDSALVLPLANPCINTSIQLAYGATGTPGGPIPPNAELTFDVKLLHVQKYFVPT